MVTTAIAAAVLARGGDAWWPLWLVFWLAVVAAAAWFLWRRWRSRRGDGLHRARKIVAERYAKGELTSDEYRERLDQLNRPAAN